MKATVESTTRIVIVDGQRCRVWQAVSEGGVPFELFVPLFQVRSDHDQARFEAEFEQPHASVRQGAIDMRYVID